MSLFTNRPSMARARELYEELKRLAEAMDPEGIYAGIKGRKIKKYRELFTEYDRLIATKSRWYDVGHEVSARPEKLAALGSDPGEHRLLKNYVLIAELKEKIPSIIDALQHGTRLRQFPFLEDPKIDPNAFFPGSHSSHELEQFMLGKMAAGVDLKVPLVCRLLGFNSARGFAQLQPYDLAYQTMLELRTVGSITRKKLNPDKEYWVRDVSSFLNEEADHIKRLNAVCPSHPAIADITNVKRVARAYMRLVPDTARPKPQVA